MNHNHLQIDKLKQNFKNIMKLSTDISKIKLRVNTKLEKMKELYNNIVKFNNTKISEKCLNHLYPLASGDWYEEYYKHYFGEDLSFGNAKFEYFMVSLILNSLLNKISSLLTSLKYF